VTWERVDREQYFDLWSALHGDVPTTGLVGAWLRVVYTAAVPLARVRLAPWSVTATGLILALLALLPAADLPALAALLLLVSGLCDSVDGTLAVLTQRTSRVGAVLDPICDRIADLCMVGALWLAGAPPWWCLAAAALAWSHEYLRAVAGNAGMPGVGVVTPGERPTRIIITVAFLLAEATPLLHYGWWATAGAVALAVVGLLGFVQLAFVVSRSLR
jgi:CDP-diacylglycerol--glycerol-3-phosphate 3-phosphatidyltransferase